MLPDSSYELTCLKGGSKIIAGADEVGRGAFAGPIVTGVVIFSPDFYINSSVIQSSLPFRITDSKKIPAKERKVAADWITTNSHKYAVGQASVREINRLGIVRASNIAFRRAVKKIEVNIDRLLIDAFFIPYLVGIPKKNQLPLVKGDSISISIAAASIVAKVYRDSLMEKLGRNEHFLPYLWSKNKGYGTSEHRKALSQYGITKYHRIQFVETSKKNSLKDSIVDTTI